MPDDATKLLIPTPADLAQATEDAMVAKATKPWSQMFCLTLYGGAFIALGFIFFITSQQGLTPAFPIGLAKVVGGLVFSVGLILVVITGADLFTGTTMTSMGLFSRRIGMGRFLGHWGIALLGNLTGAVLIAAIVMGAQLPESNKGAWGLVVMNAALGKVTHPWFASFCLGILANYAVCLAVWLANSGRSTADKVLACLLPVGLFVAAGLEHSVANMFLLPLALMIKGDDAFWATEAVTKAGKTVADFHELTLGSGVFHNLIPVILGNIVGGALMVGGYFWTAFVRPAHQAARNTQQH